MKILFLTDQIAIHGGTEKILSMKLNRFVKQGHDIHLATSEQKGKPYIYFLEDKISKIDFDINYVRTKSYFTLENIFRTIKHIIKLKKYIIQHKPDIIVSSGFGPEQYFLLLIAGKIPLIKEIHTSGSVFRPSGVSKKLFGLLRKYKKVVVLNKDEKQYYPKFNLAVIPNFIEKTAIGEVYDRENTIIAAGRIAPVKQFDHLIRAWALIAYKFPDWKIKIFGDGDEKLEKQLKELANNLNVGNSVLFPGSTNQLLTEFRKAKIYAMTSESECFPMVLLEAMSVGLPIVSYDSPHGPANIVTNGVEGIITERQNIGKFSEALRKVIEDEGLRKRMGSNAIKNSVLFSGDNVGSIWNNLFNECLISYQ